MRGPARSLVLVLVGAVILASAGAGCGSSKQSTAGKMPPPSTAAPTTPAAPSTPAPTTPGTALPPISAPMSPGTTSPSTPKSPPAAFPYQPLWPFRSLEEAQAWEQSYRAGGHQPWHLDAGATALAFTTGY